MFKHNLMPMDVAFYCNSSGHTLHILNRSSTPTHPLLTSAINLQSGLCITFSNCNLIRRKKIDKPILIKP